MTYPIPANDRVYPNGRQAHIRMTLHSNFSREDRFILRGNNDVEITRVGNGPSQFTTVRHTRFVADDTVVDFRAAARFKRRAFPAVQLLTTQNSDIHHRQWRCSRLRLSCLDQSGSGGRRPRPLGLGPDRAFNRAATTVSTPAVCANAYQTRFAHGNLLRLSPLRRRDDLANERRRLPFNGESPSQPCGGESVRQCIAQFLLASVFSFVRRKRGGNDARVTFTARSITTNGGYRNRLTLNLGAL